MYLQWETPLDKNVFDVVDHFDCGDDLDVNPGLSKVTDPTQPILGYDIKNANVYKDIHTTPFNPFGLCEISGILRHPWGTAYKIGRIELYDDSMMNNFPIFTNRAGSYFFFGIPGRRIKVHFPDGTKCWFMTPDKSKATFEEIIELYGYEI